jgi:hypothetical protein
MQVALIRVYLWRIQVAKRNPNPEALFTTKLPFSGNNCGGSTMDGLIRWIQKP